MTDHFTRPPLYLDLLDGTQAIAKYLWGPKAKGRAAVQRVHRAIDRGLPIFRHGRKIMARRSVILDWINEKERAAKDS